MSSSRSQRDKENASNRSAERFIPIFSGVVAAFAAALAPLVSNIKLDYVLFGLAVSAYVGLGSYVWILVRRTRFVDFRIALTGEPRVGKTVFANLLFDLLMGNDHGQLRFTADAKSAISVYQVVRGIDNDQWPPVTSSKSVQHLDGTLEVRRMQVDLEIGDSAGKHWLDLEPSPEYLIGESDYLRWLLSAQALVHVLPVERLLDPGETLKREITQLLLAKRLMDSTQNSRVSILIVISKLDLIDEWTADTDLMRVFSAATASELSTTRQLEESKGVALHEVFSSVEKELQNSFTDISFVYSSTRGLSRPLGHIRSGDVAAWILRHATPDRGSSSSNICTQIVRRVFR